jgi:manganese/zinc/iron transport system substrate-binding protein
MNKIIFAILTIALLLNACAPESNSDSSGKINIVTTIGMIADITKNVGGEHVEVIGLMGPGVDPHLYKASEGNVRALQEADLVFYNGLHLESQMGDVLERMNDIGIKTVAVTDKIDRTLLNAPPEFKGNYDPHIWFDVTLWMAAVEQVKETLVEVDPTHASDYEANAESYLRELESLHQYVLDQTNTLPAEKRILITAHDAFNYFGHAYGFEVRGLQGISTEAQAGTADVQILADYIVEKQIPAIFVESSVPQRTIEAVQAAVQAQGFNVQIGGSLFSDAMGSEGTPEGTYIGMVKHNIDTIVSALAGD